LFALFHRQSGTRADTGFMGDLSPEGEKALKLTAKLRYTFCALNSIVNFVVFS
jgi:hypothetical protein